MSRGRYTAAVLFPVLRASALRICCVLVVMASAVPGALAQAPDTARARALFETGVARAAEESWAEALSAFRESRAIVERPSTVYNIATTLQRLGRYREAIVAIDDYLRISDPSADAAQREAASGLRATLDRALAHLALTIEPGDARVTVDARHVGGEGQQRDVRLDPGDHVVVVAAPGHAEERIELSLAPGERIERSVRLVADGAAAAATAEPAPEPEPTAPSRSVAEEPALWIVIGAVLVAGAAITTGVVIGTQSSPGVYQGTGGFTVEALRF